MYLSVFLNRFTDCHTMKNTERIMATIPINMENPQSLCRPHFMSISITFPELKFHVPLAPSKQWPSNSCKFIETGIKMKKDPRNDTKNAITWDNRSMFPIPMVVQILSVTFNASSFVPPSYILLLRLHWLAKLLIKTLKSSTAVTSGLVRKCRLCLATKLKKKSRSIRVKYQCRCRNS